MVKKVSVIFKQKECDNLLALFKSSTKRTLTRYVHDVALQKPVIFFTRNQSLDELMYEFVEMRAEFTGLRERLTRLPDVPQVLNDDPERRQWMTTNKKQQEELLKKLEEINLKIAQMASVWLQQ